MRALERLSDAELQAMAETSPDAGHRTKIKREISRRARKPSIEERVESDMRIEEESDPGSDTPERRAQLRQIHERADEGEAALVAGTAQKIHVEATVDVTVIARLSADELRHIMQGHLVNAADELLDELMTPEGSAEHLENYIYVERSWADGDATWGKDNPDYEPVANPTATAEKVLNAHEAAVITTARGSGGIGGAGVAYVVDSNDKYLTELAQVSEELNEYKAQLTEQRNELIRKLSDNGVGSTTVARAAGMSTSALFKIIKGSQS